jgi:hypothetical protein
MKASPCASDQYGGCSANRHCLEGADNWTGRRPLSQIGHKETTPELCLHTGSKRKPKPTGLNCHQNQYFIAFRPEGESECRAALAGHRQFL